MRVRLTIEYETKEPIARAVEHKDYDTNDAALHVHSVVSNLSHDMRVIVRRVELECDDE